MDKIKKIKPKRAKLTVSDYEKALRATGGFLTHAAKKLGVSVPAVSQRIKKSARLQAVLEEIRGGMLDLAESKLKAAIKKGEAWAIAFYLKCQGKARGYIERAEYDHRVQGDVNLHHSAQLTTDQAKRLLADPDARKHIEALADIAAGETEGKDEK